MIITSQSHNCIVTLPGPFDFDEIHAVLRHRAGRATDEDQQERECACKNLGGFCGIPHGSVARMLRTP